MNRTKLKKIESIGYTFVDDKAIIWNRFYPSVLQFDKIDFFKMLKSIEENKLEKEKNKNILNKLKENKIPLSFKDDFYHDDFIKDYESHLEKKFECLTQLNKNKRSFGGIQFFNEECNLRCSYCIMKHTWNRERAHKRIAKGKMISNMINILDQQYKALEKYPDKGFNITFNGGEILVCFDVLKKVVEFIRVEKKDLKTPISLNTNGSLINDEVVDFFSKYKITLFISLDVNKIHHDKTRIYSNGKGSYDDVFCSLDRIKEKNFKLKSLQGTIEDFSLVDSNEFPKFTQLGVKSANFYSNLMGIKSKNGVNRAARHYDFHKKNVDKGIALSDSMINLFFEIIEKKKFTGVRPYCVGQGGGDGRDDKFVLVYNMSRNSLSYTCQFVPETSMKCDGRINIHDNEAAEKTFQYQKDRLSSIKKNCMDCPIIGICRGGCILMGMDAFNKKNEASCNYWLTSWYLFVKDLVKLNVEKRNDPKEARREIGDGL